MNPKIKRVIAIIGLVFMGLFLVSMFIYFVRSDLFGGMLWLFSVLCFGITLVMFSAIYFTRSFPNQEAKADEFKKLEDAYYKKLAEKEAAEEAEKDESADMESGDEESVAGEKENAADDKGENALDAAK